MASFEQQANLNVDCRELREVIAAGTALVERLEKAVEEFKAAGEKLNRCGLSGGTGVQNP